MANLGKYSIRVPWILWVSSLLQPKSYFFTCRSTWPGRLSSKFGWVDSMGESSPLTPFVEGGLTLEKRQSSCGSISSPHQFWDPWFVGWVSQFHLPADIRKKLRGVDQVFVQQTMKTASSDEELAFKQYLGYVRWLVTHGWSLIFVMM